MTTNNCVFHLTSFTPVGFLSGNYKIDMCMLCRGPLTEICYMCQEKKCTVCRVTTDDDNNNYHTHCHALLQENLKNNKRKNN